MFLRPLRWRMRVEASEGVAAAVVVERPVAVEPRRVGLLHLQHHNRQLSRRKGDIQSY